MKQPRTSLNPAGKSPDLTATGFLTLKTSDDSQSMVVAVNSRFPKPEEFICSLVESFPCLRQRWKVTPETWDADQLGRQLGVFSSGERWAALFVLCVWNPGYAKEMGWTFDPIEAASVWGTENRNAFIAWMQKPYWP